MKLDEAEHILIEEIERAKGLGIKLDYVSEKLHLTQKKSVYAENFKGSISVNEKWLEAVTNPEELRSCLMHEVLHSISGSHGHDILWQKGVRLVKNAYKYACSEYHLNEHPYSKRRIEIGESDGHTSLQTVLRPEDYKYEVMCPKCKSAWYFKRLCPTVKHPELASCRGCSSKNEKVNLIRVR